MTKSDKIFVKKLKSELEHLRKENAKFPNTEKALLNLIETYEKQ